MLYKNIELPDTQLSVLAVSNTLQRVDARLMDHGERVAFIACELCEAGGLDLDIEKLFLLSVFHDIGAYKTDEIDRMVEFETENVHNHSVYGYLFLKYMSPLSDMAQAVLYHHTPWEELERIDTEYRDYAALIHLADRFDIAFLHQNEPTACTRLFNSRAGMFKPEYTALAQRCFSSNRLYEQLADESYRQHIRKRIDGFCVPPETAIEYLKMLMLAIDLRSEQTVTHTANTVSIAMNIAQHLGFDARQQGEIYFGALLHDVGKIVIPQSILEHDGRLDDEQMRVMRTHASETEAIIKNIVPDDICKIASSHHEKLDGSGYPHGLKAAELNMNQRIVAVADIMSALVDKRSYKEPIPKEKTIAILREMQREQLDKDICDYVCDSFDSVVASTDSSRNKIIAKYTAMLAEYEALKEPA